MWLCSQFFYCVFVFKLVLFVSRSNKDWFEIVILTSDSKVRGDNMIPSDLSFDKLQKLKTKYNPL